MSMRQAASSMTRARSMSNGSPILATIDSPLENFALYQYLMGGSTSTVDHRGR